MRSQTAIFSTLVGDFMREAPLVRPQGTLLSEAIKAMATGGFSSVIVSGPQGLLFGIVTEQDITRRVAFQVAPDAPLVGHHVVRNAMKLNGSFWNVAPRVDQ